LGQQHYSARQAEKRLKGIRGQQHQQHHPQLKHQKRQQHMQHKQHQSTSAPATSTQRHHIASIQQQYCIALPAVSSIDNDFDVNFSFGKEMLESDKTAGYTCAR
jgi:hypothetical protein